MPPCGARRAPTLVAAAAFQFALYTEGLFLLLSALTLLWARRGNAALAAVAGLLGGLCRPQGVLLVLALFADSDWTTRGSPTASRAAITV